MRWMAGVLLLCVACGGPSSFHGDQVIAELRSGEPYCGPGQTGPTTTSRTVTVTDRNGQPLYDSRVLECDWTCGNIGPLTLAFVYVVFFTDASGQWQVDPHADPDRAACP